MSADNTTRRTKPASRSTPSSARREQQRQDHEEWKQSLRQACVNRARKNRKELIWKKRRQQHLEGSSPDTSMPVDNHHSDPSEQPQQGHDGESSQARSLVEEELRHLGVAVVSPGFGENSASLLLHSGRSSQPMEDSMELQSAEGFSGETGTNVSNCSHTTEYFINEAELYELMQEVEEEMKQSEDALWEEIMEQERFSEQELEEQVAHYQEWENSAIAATEEENVICPICCENVLCRTPVGHIACCSDACSFCLRPHDREEYEQKQNEQLTLVLLKERLGQAYESHASQCSCTLTFEMHPSAILGHDRNHLIASCQQCQGNFIVT